MEEELKVKLRERQSELIRIIEAFKSLEISVEWGILKELVFEKSLKSIERQILNEALSKKIDVDKIYRLQGELAWARQYNNVSHFVETIKNQLEDIKNKLN